MADLTPSRFALGKIKKAHGVRGEASVEAWTEYERFEEITDVTLVSPDESETRKARIENVRENRGRALIKFSGIDTPEEMQTLKEWTIEIPESQARTPDPDEYFIHDLVGMRLIDRSGTDRGQVIDAYEGGGGLLLHVRRDDDKEYDVPFAASICVDIDVKKKVITVELPEGIDED